MTATTDDLEALWRLRELLPRAEAPVGLPLPLLEALRDLLDADTVSFNALDSRSQGHRFSQHVTCEGGPTGEPDEAAFWAHYWDSEPCSYPDRTGDLGSVTLLSDFYDRRTYHAHPMYREYLRYAEVEHELMLALPDGGPQRTLRLLVTRSEGPDFTERDRFLVELLRPHLAATYARCEATRRGTTLTPRQRAVLALVRDGATNRAIARRLGISEGTVRTHLQNAYDVLGVSSRTAAAVRAAALS